VTRNGNPSRVRGREALERFCARRSNKFRRLAPRVSASWNSLALPGTSLRLFQERRSRLHPPHAPRRALERFPPTRRCALAGSARRQEIIGEDVRSWGFFFKRWRQIKGTKRPRSSPLFVLRFFPFDVYHTWRDYRDYVGAIFSDFLWDRQGAIMLLSNNDGNNIFIHIILHDICDSIWYNWKSHRNQSSFLWWA